MHWIGAFNWKVFAYNSSSSALYTKDKLAIVWADKIREGWGLSEKDMAIGLSMSFSDQQVEIQKSLPVGKIGPETS